MKIAQPVVLTCAAMLILGCGQKGPLVLPDAQKHKRTIPTLPGAQPKPSSSSPSAPEPASTAAQAPTPAPAPAPETPSTAPPSTPPPISPPHR